MQPVHHNDHTVPVCVLLRGLFIPVFFCSENFGFTFFCSSSLLSHFVCRSVMSPQAFPLATIPPFVVVRNLSGGNHPGVVGPAGVGELAFTSLAADEIKCAAACQNGKNILVFFISRQHLHAFDVAVEYKAQPRLVSSALPLLSCPAADKLMIKDKLIFCGGGKSVWVFTFDMVRDWANSSQ
jgi:hypothetical protein